MTGYVRIFCWMLFLVLRKFFRRGVFTGVTRGRSDSDCEQDSGQGKIETHLHCHAPRQPPAHACSVSAEHPFGSALDEEIGSHRVRVC